MKHTRSFGISLTAAFGNDIKSYFNIYYIGVSRDNDDNISAVLAVCSLHITCVHTFCVFLIQQKGTPMKGLQVANTLPSYPSEPVAPTQGKKGTSALSVLLEMEQK